MLAHLLQQHPDILAPPEPWLMLALEAFGTVDNRHPAGAPLIRGATSEFLGRIDRRIVARALADAAYGQYLAATGKRTFIDKTPRYWMVLDFLDGLYPEAQRIVLFRNPYAIAASVKAKWGIPLSSASCPSAIASCLADLAVGLPPPSIASSLADLVLGLPTLAAQRGRHDTLVVRYEHLVAHPEHEVRRAIAALGYDPEQLASATVEQTDYLRSSSFGDRKILERRAVDDRSVRIWQMQLTTQEMQAVTDLVGAELLNELGYGEELRYAQQVGVTDRGPAVTEGYRQLFKACFDLSAGITERGSGVTGLGTQPNSALSQVLESSSSFTSVSSIVREAQGLADTKIEETLRLVKFVAAEIEQALTASRR
ncbi:sulfotransferase family protein [Bradyrhizobium sp. STM 3562]|uniref:nodulation protein NoeE n=1 Tax=Bradyrhizobium sp. STM 3562 TaxID=578924 RepID=UPI0038906521